MLFNSIVFIIFFAIVAALRWLLPVGWAARKAILLVASVIFYGAWRPEYLLLILISMLIDWVASQRIYSAQTQGSRRGWLMLSLLSNLGMLAFFKYGNFFISNVNAAGALAGQAELITPLNILLPVGISFYTFQTLSYTIDVYRGSMRPWGSFWDFALFVTFFPQLVAGPIVRAVDFQPQCEREVAVDGRVVAWGASLCLIGMFQKIVLADALLAPTVDRIFGAKAATGLVDTWIGTLAFSGQIYYDFAGYSISAIGLAMMLGFILPDNFNAPYAAKGFSDFWKRWHISLSSWLRDYLYISLGGNRGGVFYTYRNLVLTMLLGGLWHGASWNFLLWGALHGLYLVIERLVRGYAAGISALGGIAGQALGIGATYALVCIAWIPFRADSIQTSLWMMLGAVGLNSPTSIMLRRDLLVIPVIAGMLGVQLACRRVRLEEWVSRAPAWVIVCAGVAMLLSILMNSGASRAFVYFQF